MQVFARSDNITWSRNEVISDSRNRRIAALNQAKIFLLPYKDIWRNLTLSNKYCRLSLRADGTTIVGTEKVYSQGDKARSFRVVSTGVLDPNEIFNMFCKTFEYNTSYDGLVETCHSFGLTISESGNKTQQEYSKPQPEIRQAKAPVKLIPESDKTDVNNCSEVELTALPGISIVIAKKIIKRREEIKGFKSVDDFIKFINLKSNITEQLRQMIVTNKMKGSLNTKRNKERTIDL